MKLLLQLRRVLVAVKGQVISIPVNGSTVPVRSFMNSSLVSSSFPSHIWHNYFKVQYRTCSSSTHSVETIGTSSEGAIDQINTTQENPLTTAACRIYEAVESEVRKRNNNIKLLPIEECVKILGLFIKYKIPEEDMQNILSKVPILLTFPHMLWEETIRQLLRNYQYSPVQLLPLLADTPAILDGSVWKSMNEVFALLRSWGIREGKIQMVILKNSELLSKNIRSTMNNFANLCTIFTKSNVLSLIVSNSNVLTDEWETTHAKISYVCEKMGVKPSEILKTNLFKHDLDHIITRHEFLERAGLYSKPDKRGVSKTENDSLRIIMDSDDKAFAKLVAGLSLEEYNVFVKLKKQELEEAEELKDEDE